MTGPEVSREEVREATEEFQVKALDYRLKQIQRINEIGYSLVGAIPGEDITIRSRPYLGLFYIPRSDISERLFKSSPEEGVFIAFVFPNTPAFQAGVQRGDVLVAINNRRIRNEKSIPGVLYDLEPEQPAVLTVIRGGEEFEKAVTVQELPVDVHFTVVDRQDVNAAAGTNSILVTYGLLNFAKSDDEIAAVLGHELAHLSRGHVSRIRGSSILAQIAAIGLGITAEIFAPGSGEAVARGVGGIGGAFNARFSRDLEREADYFGVKFLYHAGYDPEVAATIHERFAIEVPQSLVSNYLSTHPSSPERKLRIQKSIEEFRAGEPSQDELPDDPTLKEVTSPAT